MPYYMFVERDTGAKHYFKVPLARAVEIYRAAFQRVSGLARTARGPVMSALPGKVCIDGVCEIDGRPVFAMSFLQARQPSWCNRPFFADFDSSADWLTDLCPAFGRDQFFYESELQDLLLQHTCAQASLPQIVRLPLSHQRAPRSNGARLHPSADLRPLPNGD